MLVEFIVQGETFRQISSDKKQLIFVITFRRLVAQKVYIKPAMPTLLWNQICHSFSSKLRRHKYYVMWHNMCDVVGHHVSNVIRLKWKQSSFEGVPVCTQVRIVSLFFFLLDGSANPAKPYTRIAHWPRYQKKIAVYNFVQYIAFNEFSLIPSFSAEKILYNRESKKNTDQNWNTEKQ